MKKYLVVAAVFSFAIQAQASVGSVKKLTCTDSIMRGLTIKATLSQPAEHFMKITTDGTQVATATIELGYEGEEPTRFTNVPVQKESMAYSGELKFAPFATNEQGYDTTDGSGWLRLTPDFDVVGMFQKSYKFRGTYTGGIYVPDPKQRRSGLHG